LLSSEEEEGLEELMLAPALKLGTFPPWETGITPVVDMGLPGVRVDDVSGSTSDVPELGTAVWLKSEVSEELVEGDEVGSEGEEVGEVGEVGEVWGVVGEGWEGGASSNLNANG
jgi:hypothetical protein